MVLKGFLGPIGDDIPSILAIVMALGLFFSALVVALDAYNTKVVLLRSTNAANDIARVVTSYGLLDSDAASSTWDEIKLSVGTIAATYGVKYSVSVETMGVVVGDNTLISDSILFAYLVPVWDSAASKTYIRVLEVRVK